jgi:hypothetical protein
VSRAIVSDRILDAAHERQARSDGWHRAACVVCQRSILVRGRIGNDPLDAPCCSVECAGDYDRVHSSSDESRDCLGLAVHGRTPDNEDR